MPDLPKVSQEFDADVNPYITGIEEMILANGRFIDSVNEAIAKVAELKTMMAGLVDKHITVTVTTVYEYIGAPPPDLGNETRTIRYVSEGDVPRTFAPAVQAVREQSTGVRTVLPPAFQPVIEQMGAIPQNLGGMDLAELKKIAAELNIAGRSKMNKSTLVEQITETRVAGGFASGFQDLQKQISQLEEMQRAEAGLKTVAEGKNVVMAEQAVVTAKEGAEAVGAAVGQVALSKGMRDTTAAAIGNRDAVSLLGGFWRQWGSVIHYVVMLTAEFLAVFIPAMVAAAAAMAVAMQGAQNVQIRFTSIYTAAEALGGAVNRTAGQMLGLSDVLQKAQNAVQPQIYELFGGVLNGLKDHMGGLWQMGTQVIGMLDTFVAKLDVELRSGLGDQLNQLVSKGAQDLKGFGQELGNLGRALLNLASAMPGLAEVILKILVAFTDLIKIVSELPRPLITAAFALEEFLRWGSLLINVGGRLVAVIGGLIGAAGFEGLGRSIAEAGRGATASAGTFGGLFRTIISFAVTNPLAAIGVAAALALGGFAYWVRKAQDGTDQWVASVNKMVTGGPDFSQINTTISALGANTKNLAQAQEILNSKTSDWSRLASGAQQDFNALDNQHKQLTGDIFTETGNVALLANKYGVDIPTAIAFANAAGVKLTTNMQGQSTAAQVARQQIQNMITGYQAMGQQGNQLVADINAVTIANSTQIQNVTKLNQAWQTIVTNNTKVQTSFITFQQGLATISTNAKAAGASFDGLNAASLTLRSSFESNVGNLSTMEQTLNTAMSVGALSWNKFRSVVATTVLEMMKAGPISSAQAAQLGLLASAAGYTGTNYGQLQSWTGKYATTQSGANNIIDQATIKMSNLKQMTGQLQGALQSDVIGATAKAVLSQEGFQAALSKTYDDFKKGGPSSAAFKGDLADLDKALRNAGFSQQQVAQYNQFLEKQFKDTSGIDKSNAALKGNQDTIDTSISHTRSFGSTVKDIMDAMGHNFMTNMDGIKTAAKTAWDFISGSAGISAHQVVTAWNTSIGGLKTAWSGVEGIAKTTWGAVYTDIITPVRNAITDVKSAFVSGFDGWWKTHGDAIKQIWNAAWQGILGISNTVSGVIVQGAKAFWNDLTGLFGTGSTNTKGIMRTMWNDITTITKAFWNEIAPFIKTEWDIVKTTFSAAWAVIEGIEKIGWDVLKSVTNIEFGAIKAFIKSTWDLVVGIFNVGIDLITGHWRTAWTDMKNTMEQIWNNMMGFFRTIWSNLETGFRNVVSTLGSTWSKLESIFRGPVSFLVNTVYDGGIARFWNDVMGFVGGPKLPTFKFAGGGKIPGYGGGDIVPAYLEPGEAVVPKHLVGAVAPFLSKQGVPGFAAGGYVNPIGPGLRPERIDMGVDYGGSGPLYALGAGTITNLFNAGWPGGGFISLHLSGGPDAGGFFYYAEDVQPLVHIGQIVKAGQHIANATGGSTGIEVGWAANASGTTMAAATGQSAQGSAAGDPGAFPTGWGVFASNLIASLGGPRGIQGSHPVVGSIPKGGSIGINPGGGLGSIFGAIIKGVFHAITGTIAGLGDAASVIAAIATGNTTALANAMGKLIGAGGAKADLAKMIIGVPKTLIKDSMKWFSNFVHGHTTTQTTSIPGIGLPVVPGPHGYNVGVEEAFAQAHLAAYGWGPGQMKPLIELWTKESGWNPYAVNPASGAYGIPQSLGHGHPYNLGDYQAQIIWGMNYIKNNRNYGTPAAAWAHELAHNWYDEGGWLMPGATLAINNTGRPERVMGPNEAAVATAPIQVNVHLDGKQIFTSMQKATFAYNMRNRGQITGGLSNLNK